MALTSHRSKRKASGGRYKDYRKKRVFEIRNKPILTKIAERRVKILRGVGGFIRKKLLSVKEVNVYDPKTKKYSKEEIKSVLKNDANRHFVRRNIITKGAVVETAKGKVKITSRPGQEPILNGILVK
jgi:small subunit ribosomal protein S8e